MRVVLCGYGHYGRRIATMLEEHDIVAICEPNTMTAALARQEFPKVLITSDVSCLNSHDIDIVWECGSVNNRKNVYQWAIDKHLPIVLEKPLALTEDKLIDFYGGRFTVNFREIYHPVIKMTKEYLHSEGRRLKAVSFIRTNTIAYEKAAVPKYREAVTGGSLLDKCIHDIANLVFCIAPVEQFSIKKITVHKNIPNINYETIDFSIKAHEKGHYEEDLYAEIEFIYQTPTQSIPVRVLSSWIGINPDQVYASHPKIIKQALWHANDTAKSNSTLYAPWHCKLMFAEFVSPTGDGTLIGSTLERQGCSPFLLVKHNGRSDYIIPDNKQKRHIYNNFCNEVINNANSATISHVQRLLDVHRIVFQLKHAIMSL